MRANKIPSFAFYPLVFLILFFLSAIISSHLFLKGEMVILPNIVGKSMDEARAELAKKKISVVQKGIQFNNHWEEGTIITQDPSPGSKIRINKVVKVILSAGSEKVMVPQFIGKSFQTIGPFLKDTGLRKGNVSQVHTSRYAAGKIIAQYPPSSEEVPRNSQVALLVSQGEREKKYLTPDMIGKQAELVIDGLKKLKFRIGDVRYSYYPGLDPGIIIKQFPPHGYPIQRNYPITLEVSK